MRSARWPSSGSYDGAVVLMGTQQMNWRRRIGGGGTTWVVRALLCMAVLHPTAAQRAHATGTSTIPPPCWGDCNNDGVVTVDEIITMVNFALDVLDISACPAGKSDPIRVGIADIIA